MMTKRRLFYLWCLLVAAIFLASLLPGSSRIYRVIAGCDSNRWVHFLAYALAAAIPVAAWRRTGTVLLSFLVAVMSVVLELLHAHGSGPFPRAQNIAADLFGAAAGILLGLNLRMMRNSGRSLNNVSSASSR
jgi:hypothetical protein